MNLSTEMTARLTKELVPGESVVWSMQLGHREFFKARQGCLLVAAALLLIPCLPLLLLGDHKAWGIVGALLLISVLLVWSSIRQYRKTYFQSAYAITDKRAIVLAGPQLADARQTEAQVWSFYPDALRNRESVVRKDGTGDIIFWHKRFSGEDFSVKIMFNELPNVNQIDTLLGKVVMEDDHQNKTASDEEISRSLERDYAYVCPDNWQVDNYATRKDIPGMFLMGLVFLAGGIYACGCGFNIWSFDHDSSRSDRMYLMMLGVASIIGAVAVFLGCWYLPNRVERRIKVNAQPTSAGDVATRAAPEK